MRIVKIMSGFVLLFILYHAAEYMILFQNSPAGFLGFQFLFFIAAWLVGRWQTGKGLAGWGLNRGKGFLMELLVGITMGMALYGAVFLIGLAIGSEKIIQIPFFASIAGPLFLFVFGNFFSSLSEDILTRGYVYYHLKEKIPLQLIAIISALIYLLNHIYRIKDGPQAWIYLFALGVLFVIPLLVTKRLWFTGGMHWAGNCVFFYTHQIVGTTNGPLHFSFNYLLVIWIVVLVLPTYFIARSFREGLNHEQ
ncbi:MAG: CPBP family intramembrane glutamic endopeptidase [Flavisolibacter sp.]